MITKTARIAAWLLVMAAVFLTLGPPKFRPVLGIERSLEHFMAFALVAFVFGLAYLNHRVAFAMLAVALAALLEILQLWVPGRHAYFSDFVINASGGCAGLALATWVELLRQRWTLAPARIPDLAP